MQNIQFSCCLDKIRINRLFKCKKRRSIFIIEPCCVVRERNKEIIIEYLESIFKKRKSNSLKYTFIICLRRLHAMLLIKVHVVNTHTHISLIERNIAKTRRHSAYICMSYF